MQLNKNNKILLMVILIVAAFVLGDIWGSHKLPFQGDALQSSANGGCPNGQAVCNVKIGVGAETNNWKRICNSGWWWYYSECYGGKY